MAGLSSTITPMTMRPPPPSPPHLSPNEDLYLSDSSSDDDEDVAAGWHLLSLLGSTLASSIDADLNLFSSDPAVRSALNDDEAPSEVTDSDVPDPRCPAPRHPASGPGTTLARIEDEFRHAEAACVFAYEVAASDLRDLSSEVSGCLSLLTEAEETLLGLQADLSGVGADALGRLRYRYLCARTVEEADAEAVAGGFLRSGAEGDGNNKESPASRINLVPGNTVAGAEMRAHVGKLRLFAASRIRSYFLHDAIPKIRAARTNIRMVQVNALLRYRSLLDFVWDVSPEVYEEVRDVYVESMAKALHVLFRTYGGQLSKLDAKVGGRHFGLIAVDEVALRSAAQGKERGRRDDSLNIGERTRILDLIGTAPILVHVALAEGEKYPYEMVFRSIMKHLMDSATNEYKFTSNFFRHSGKDAFTAIFSRTLSLVLEQLETYLFSCYDFLGLLLMMKLNHGHRRIMHSRQVHVLDPFFDRVTMLLWPRHKMLLDSQVRAIRAADADRLGGVELHPHYISRRYAEFISSVLLILYRTGGGGPGSTGPPANPGQIGPRTGLVRGTAAGNPAGSVGSSLAEDAGSIFSRGPGEILLADLAAVHEDFVALLRRLAGEHQTPKDGIVFLINNYDQIVQILEERRAIGTELRSFEDMLLQQRELFVEEELLDHGHLNNMIAFVRAAERQAMMDSGSACGRSGAAPPFDPHVVEGLLRDFAATWKKTIERINRNVLSYFSSFRNGMEILKQALTQLLLYYTRFQDVIRKAYRKLPSFCKDLVSTTVILAEIKKYALAI
uniref:Vps52 C-terminal domain-containing protein n=1 Tax=Corethron hystrix TaxID=216773 RepID=A0A7S1B6C6_9STRA|mmetsp:Transcript_14721/g.32520  ORF Transcript_14721/g.32520 Transcript_14721/m.32520 type:complete len:785 (+) Transcript_14721:130-2484(+)